MSDTTKTFLQQMYNFKLNLEAVHIVLVSRSFLRQGIEFVQRLSLTTPASLLKSPSERTVATTRSSCRMKLERTQAVSRLRLWVRLLNKYTLVSGFCSGHDFCQL